MTDLPLAVFAYAFPHRKTHDFLTELVIGGFRNLCVIAAPWRELKHSDGEVFIPKKLNPAPAINTADICAALHIPYFEVAHEDVDAIEQLTKEYDLQVGIITGARILKRQIIDLFVGGVINFHPGSLPETAGLDLFYHTIRSGARLGVTTHFIDHRVDAGRQIFFEETSIGPNDKPEEVEYNNYQTQIRALRRLMSHQNWAELETFSIDRPQKNQPMSPNEKREALSQFPVWRNARCREQTICRLIDDCRDGNCISVADALAADASLVECRSPEGWTPLIVASFNQQAECVKLLLDFGADPNVGGKNGTTALMYAKTAIVNRPEASRDVIGILLKAGADPYRRDVHGRDIFYYLRELGDEPLAEWLEKTSID